MAKAHIFTKAGQNMEALGQAKLAQEEMEIAEVLRKRAGGEARRPKSGRKDNSS